MYNSNNNKPTLEWKRYVCTYAFLFLTYIVYADNLGFNFVNDKHQSTIHFKLVGNLVVIPVTINNGINVNLVLDTGGRSLILFGKSFRKVLDPVPGKTIPLTGYGKGGKKLAGLSLNNVVTVSPDVQGVGIGIILVNDKYFFPFDSRTKIHGIIGYQIFSRFTVQIDYPNRLITLTEPYHSVLADDFKSLGLMVKDTKPYIEATVEMGDISKKAFFHIDTGSARKVILFHSDKGEILEDYKLYRCSIGKGLNGNIQGYKSKQVVLTMAGIKFKNIDPYIVSREFSDRELATAFGSIGSEFLKDFVIILDYVNQKFHYKKVAG